MCDHACAQHEVLFMRINFWVFIVYAGFLTGIFGAEDKGLLVWYDFNDVTDNKITDISMSGEPLDLEIVHQNKVKHLPGAVQITSKSVIRSQKPAYKIINAIKKSGEISIESWVTPDNLKQEGPARIVSLSSDTSNRNFTVGQEKNKFDFRFRTSSTNKNGMPSVTSGNEAVRTVKTHLVYTRDKSGLAIVYINGEKVSSKKVKGDLRSWDNKYHLVLANELTADRPWLGTLHKVAIFSKSLSQEQVKKHFQAGADSGLELVSVSPEEVSRELFRSKVASILAGKCVECHDSANRKAGLDLTVKSLAMLGGNDGPVIKPGDSKNSLLFESIHEDDMPKKRPPLSRDEKEVIKKWIDTGAVWAFDRIDPVLYVHEYNKETKWIRRLTVDEYINSVQDSLGIDISDEARKLLPKDLKADGFSNTAYNLTVDMKHVKSFSTLAESIVDRLDVMGFAGGFEKKITFDEKSMSNLVRKMGLKLYRKPLSEEEVKSLLMISREVQDLKGTVKEAVSYILQAMLQSPGFLYRIEKSGEKYSQYNLATKLSFAVWGSSPDQELLSLVSAGKLSGAEIDNQISRLLKDQRAKSRSVKFVTEWLKLDHLDNMKPSEEKFPNWNPDLAADMKNETVLFFKDLVWQQNRPLSHLLNARFTYLTPELARHYGIKPKSAAGMQKYDLQKVPSRGGILTQGSILSLGGDEASMVTRGLFVLHDLLRGKVNDPPPEADTTPVPSKQGLTQRGISMERIADKKCGGCHGKFEPLAFGLEKFDGLGAFKESDKFGNKLRDDGEMFIPFNSKALNYKNSREMMDHLAASQRVKETITAKLLQFVIGRPLNAGDIDILTEINKKAQTDGGTYQGTMKAILTSGLITENN